jgi:hypothetical protein
MRVSVRAACAFLLFMCALAPGVPALAQSPTPESQAAAAASAGSTDLLKVFLDCDRCDGQHVRQTVGFVDHVFDRTVADVHVLVTTENTGGGGLSWVVQFIGANRLAGQTHTLRFDTSATATSDERRNAFVRIFRLGLATHAAGTRVAPQLNVTWTAPTGGTGRTTVTRDPWNYWVFNARVNGSMDGQRSSRSVSHNLSLTANRTTDNLKISANASANTSKNTFEFEDSADVTSRRHTWNVGGRIVKTVGPHWAAGFVTNVSHSSFSNIDQAITFAPAIEFNVFPYSESSRRSLTIYYTNGVQDHTYTEVTIYDRLRETYARHATGAVLALQQPWGSLEVSSRFSQYLKYLERYNASVSTSADVRLFNGFSFNVYGSYERVKDQVSLRKAGASEQEVLLRIQQLATGYEYYVSLGVTYRFGSIFNNIVNTRFNELFF